MKYINCLMAIAISGMLGACNDYLDPNEYALQQKDQIFSVTTIVGNMSAGIYGCIPHQKELGMSAATDECESVDNTEPLQNFNTGNWNKYNNPDDVWTQCYKGIRIANDILVETDTLTWAGWRYTNPTKYTELIRNLNTCRAEARFLSAYLYFELLKRYGEVPLIKSKLAVSPGMDLSEYHRAPMADIVDYICEQCDIVCREGKWYKTPEQIAIETNNGRELLKSPYRDTLELAYPTSGDLSKYLGRATKASAYALKAKTLVYYASRLFNPDNDIQRWIKAAEACKKVIDLPKAFYGLETNYADLFQKQNLWSKEFLFVRKVGAENTFEKANYPVSIEGGNTGICPSQNLVDAYEVVEYDGEGVAVASRKFDWTNDVDKANPYENRDPRFYNTIYKHGDKYNSTVNTIILDCMEGGNSAQPIYHATKTGYYLKKYINSGLDLKNDKKEMKTWVLMRMADFYLHYAEAVNEVYGPTVSGEWGLTAQQALNMVRKRAGMPEVKITDREEFREKVYIERQIELAFENQRWWDVRRWQYGQLFNMELRGVKISLHSGRYLYEPVAVEKRTFDEGKMYLYPIPQSEIDRVGLEQNVNW